MPDRSADHEEEVADLDAGARADRNLVHRAVPWRPELVLHLHGLDDEQLLALGHRIARGDRDRDDDARDDRMDVCRPAAPAVDAIAASALAEGGTCFRLDED